MIIMMIFLFNHLLHPLNRIMVNEMKHFQEINLEYCNITVVNILCKDKAFVEENKNHFNFLALNLFKGSVL